MWPWSPFVCLGPSASLDWLSLWLGCAFRLRCSLGKWEGQAPASMGLASRRATWPQSNLGSRWKEVEAGLYHGEEVSPEASLGPLSHQPLSLFLVIHVAFSISRSS